MSPGVLSLRLARLLYASSAIPAALVIASCTAAPMSVSCASILALQPAVASADVLTLLGTPPLRLPLTQCRFSGSAASGECWWYRIDPPRNSIALQVVFVNGTMVEATLERVELRADQNTVLFRATAHGVAKADRFGELLACDG